VRRGDTLVASLLIVLFTACDNDSARTVVEPLVSSGRRPDILIESRQVAPPPAVDGNRFVSGWWPWKREGEVLLVSVTPSPRLEGVRISDLSRRLVIDGEILKSPSNAWIEAVVGGRSTGRTALAFPLEIELPTDLPLGRFLIELELSADTQIAVRTAGFRHVAPGGKVEADDSSIVQSGYSLADYVLMTDSGTMFETSFEPPAGAHPQQRFELWIERQGSDPTKIFGWRPGFWNRLRGTRSLRVDLGEGLVRLRFASFGDGPSGRWQRPTLVQPIALPVPATQVSRRPKLVLVYVMDALRADHLGHLGGPPGVSPTLDRLAEGGVTLLNHYSVAPNTFPSIKSLFLGRTPRYDGGWKLQPGGELTLAESFRQSGYRTGLFSGNGLASALYGTDRGFDHVADEVVAHGFGASGYSDNAEQVHRAMLDWLDALSPEEPVFIYAQTLHPHNPYAPPPSLEQLFTAGIESNISGSTAILRDIKQGRLEATDEDRARLRALYAASVRYNDDLIAELLRELEARYEPDETLFIATSDHGDELFEHGGVLHGYTLYEEQIHIPAVFWWPNRLSPCRLDTPSDHLDIHYTLRALLGDSDTETWNGRSLWPEIESCTSLVDPGHVRFVAASSIKGGIFLARSGNLKYIWAPRGGTQWGQGEGTGRTRDGEYVFDLASDPREQVNLAGQPDIEIDWLRSQVLSWIDNDPTKVEDQEEAVIDEKERDRLKALGYLD